MVDKVLDSKYINRKLIFKRKSKPEDSEVRCTECGRLLYKVLYKSTGSIIEVKCRCGAVHRGL